ncbi:Mth938-like domain-containing protein [candidate division WOR-3 bacterium]|nr:Mth938-like domain-containing protein [candidate division WOR-3 bacterium]
MIDSYEFGHIVIDGESYSNDVIILPDRIITHWWRKEGHRLAIEDLKDIFEENIDTLIVGTGAYGVMKVDEETKRELEKRGIKLIIAPTEDAVKIYNNSTSDKTAACLHLTC